MKKTLAEIEKLRLNAIEKNRNCFENGCHSKSIDSHILQKNGVISRISERGHVKEFVTDPFQEHQIRFKKTGINEVFTFKGFCQEHDNSLFEEIEKKNFDLNNYRHQLLFAYRTSVNETRKKESAIDFYQSLINNHRFNFDSLDLGKRIASEKMGIADSSFTRTLLKENLSNSDKCDFVFLNRELPYYEVCVSGVCTFETSFEIKEMELQSNPKFLKPLTDVFVTLLPVENKSILLIGFVRDYNPKCDDFYHRLFKQADDETIIQHVSDLMLLQIENWITSISFYNSQIFPNESKIKSILHWARQNWDERLSIDYNIFKN